MTDHAEKPSHAEDASPSQVNELCDKRRAGLGTADMSLEQMLKEMRHIRETQNDED